MKTATKLWIGLAILAALSPLGILLPQTFKAGDAWGEWGTDTLKALTGYIPQGLEKLSSLWKAPMPDYAFRGWEGRGAGHLSLAAIVSAGVGIAVTVLLVVLIGRFLAKKGE